MATIPIEDGAFAIVDDCDEHWLKRFRWVLKQPERAHYPYAATSIGSQVVYMHRLVMGECGKGMLVDHIDHDGLNNRRENLRLCHHTQNNLYSRKINPKGHSRFKGVRVGYKDQWKAGLMRDGKRLYLGSFKTEEDAARAYDAKVKELDGPFACTNESMGLFNK